MNNGGRGQSRRSSGTTRLGALQPGLARMLNEAYLDPAFGAKFKAAYRTRYDGEEGYIPADGTPDGAYLHQEVYPIMVLPNFLDREEALKLRQHLLEKIPYRHKSSDLFEFYQTGDLKQFLHEEGRDEVIAKVCLALFDSRWVATMANIIDRPLDSTNIDISSQCYRQGNHLLCHDDRLEGRRVAFVLYLVDEDWSADEDGGRLEFFASDYEGRPGLAAKAGITPQFNTLVAFEVSMFSHHQVGEVLGHRPRLSVAGWFHDPPVVASEAEKIEAQVWNDVLEGEMVADLTRIARESPADTLQLSGSILHRFAAPWIDRAPWLGKLMSSWFRSRVGPGLDWQTRPQLIRLPPLTPTVELPSYEDQRLYVVYCIYGEVDLGDIILHANQMASLRSRCLSAKQEAAFVFTSFQLGKDQGGQSY